MYTQTTDAIRLPDSAEPDTASMVSHPLVEFSLSGLEGLFFFSPEAIVAADCAGIIRASNSRAGELFGYTEADLMEMPIENLMAERYRDRHVTHRENYEAHPCVCEMGASFNLFGMRKDGSEFPVDIMLRPVQTESGPMTLSFIRDISEQRAALDKLRCHDQQLRSIIESIHDYAIYLLDLDGNVMTWNPGAEKIIGYCTDEILGAHFSRFFTEEDVKQNRPQELLRLTIERGRYEEEGWRVRKDGTRFWTNSILSAIHDVTGRLTGFAKVTRDLTDRRRAEEAVMLQLSSALLANMDVRKLLDAISASMREVIPHDAATLGLYDKAKEQLTIQFLGANDAGGAQRGDVRLPVQTSPAGDVIRLREPVLVTRFRESRFSVDALRPLSDLGMNSACWVPLIHRGDVIGTLTIASRHEEAFGEREAEMLGKVADQVAMAVNHAVTFRQIAELRDRLSQEKKYLEEEINLEHCFEDIVGESSGLRQVLKQIETVAPTDATVLIQGETGTGKELLARAIHRLSARKERTFVKLNCAAIPAGLLESELFGHEKGAFTGAIARKLGRLELAHEGTLFLDEISEMPLDLQPKVLRALQEREIERLGGLRPIAVNIRLIAATNRDLGKMVAEKQFRADLFYRLKVFPVFSPALRNRVDDIPILVRHFVAAHSRRMGRTIETIPDETMEALRHWKWPGNIRELENFLERAVILTHGPVLYAPLAELRDEDDDPSAESARNPTLEEAEREHIVRVLREMKGQIGGSHGAAAKLGLKRTTLNSKIKKLGIGRSDYIWSS